MSEWKAIETAPDVKVGDAPIAALVYGREIGVYSGRIARYGDIYLYAGVAHINGNLAEDGTITHWMPLPTAPEGSTR